MFEHGYTSNGHNGAQNPTDPANEERLLPTFPKSSAWSLAWDGSAFDPQEPGAQTPDDEKRSSALR